MLDLGTERKFSRERSRKELEYHVAKPKVKKGCTTLELKQKKESVPAIIIRPVFCFPMP